MTWVDDGAKRINTQLGYIVREGYVPREQVSPSSIKLARMCERAWGYRYILGYKEPEAEWSEFLPGARLAQRPTDKEELKAWNRLRRPALGKAVHALLEDWYAGRSVDWHSEPGRILLPALMYFPHPSKILACRTEEQIAGSFVPTMTGGKHNYEFNAFIDVNGAEGDEVSLLDLKTTSSFDWALKPEELLLDTQGIVYPLYVMWKQRGFMQHRGKSAMTPRWVYTLTEGEPKARAVDFRVTYAGALKRALPIFDEGAILIQKIRDRADPNGLAANVAACDMYHRKCVYHHSVGGPCNAESSPGKMARAFLARGVKQEKVIMAFSLKKPAENPESNGASEEKPPVEAGEGAVQQTEEQQAAQKRTYNRKAPAAAAGKSADGITVTFPDGSTLPIPAASPIAAKLSAIHSALFGE